MTGPILTWLLEVDRLLKSGPVPRSAPSAIYLDAKHGQQLVKELLALKQAGDQADVPITTYPNDMPRLTVGSLTVEWTLPRWRPTVVTSKASNEGAA